MSVAAYRRVAPGQVKTPNLIARNNDIVCHKFPVVGVNSGGNVSGSKGILPLPANLKPLNNTRAATNKTVKPWSNI